MVVKLQSKPLPLATDETGTIRIAGTRIPLDTVIIAFHNGESAEEIVESFDVLRLADIYTVIGYYLENQEEVDAYLQQRREESAELRQEIEKRFPSHNLRHRLLARKARHAKNGG